MTIVGILNDKNQIRPFTPNGRWQKTQLMQWFLSWIREQLLEAAVWITESIKDIKTRTGLQLSQRDCLRLMGEMIKFWVSEETWNFLSGQYLKISRVGDGGGGEGMEGAGDEYFHIFACECHFPLYHDFPLISLCAVGPLNWAASAYTPTPRFMIYCNPDLQSSSLDSDIGSWQHPCEREWKC